jgi:methyl-accepting chemotaxis protein
MTRRLQILATVLLLTMCVSVALFVVRGFSSVTEEHASSTLANVSRLALQVIDAQYPGPWSLEDGELAKGGHVVNGDEALVDKLEKGSGAAVTLFAKDRRVATTVKKADGSRAIGTSAAPNVRDAVITQGRAYQGAADVVGVPYLTAY